MGLYLTGADRDEEAEALLQESLRRIEEFLGPDHSARAGPLIVLSRIRLAAGDSVGAITIAEQAVDACLGVAGKEEVLGESFECLAQALEGAGNELGAASVRAEAAELRQ